MTPRSIRTPVALAARLPRQVGVAAAALVVFLLLAPSTVRADCQPVDSVEAALEVAEVAFVGTVLQTAPGQGALFRVEEAWVGQLGSTIEVGGLHGGGLRVVRPNQEVPPVEPEPVGFAEDDRVWEVGHRYLVIPNVDGGGLVDHICSGTTPWSNELAALRPPTATVAEPAASTASPLPWPVLIAGALVLVVALAGWLAFRRTDPAR